MDEGFGKAKLPQSQPVTRRGFLRSTVRLGIGGTAATLGGLGWSLKEPHWLETTEQEFILPRLPRAFDGFRIAHVSDFHVDDTGITTADRLRDIVHRINAQRPDAVMLTGDYVTVSGPRWAEEFGRGFVGLTCPVRIAVLGNHDHWSGAAPVREALHHCRIQELLNAKLTLRRGHDVLHLCGLDDPFGNPRIERFARSIPKADCAVVMQHQPDLADKISKTGAFDLQLSGHSHGGQIRLPGIGALHLPPGAKKYEMGLYQVGGMQLFTTRGIGTLMGVRFNCRPEISMITLRAA